MKNKITENISRFFRTIRLIALIFIFPIIFRIFRVRREEFFSPNILCGLFCHFRTPLDYSSELRAAITLTQIQNAPTPKRIAKTKSISQDDALRGWRRPTYPRLHFTPVVYRHLLFIPAPVSRNRVTNFFNKVSNESVTRAIVSSCAAPLRKVIHRIIIEGHSTRPCCVFDRSIYVEPLKSSI